MGWYDDRFKPYVPVAQRRAQAAKEVAKMMRKGEKVSPVVIEGRTIASTFWGQAWCTNLEGYSDFANRLPRGRTYARNGSVVDLKIEKGRIKALVSGSELYKIQIDIAPVPKEHWRALKERCSGQIGSLVELLQGKLSGGVMALVTDRERGLFPKPKEITMRCSCPDYAGMCKHLAAVMYGVGHRLDSSPELLFVLRAVDHTELIEHAIPAAPLPAKRGKPAIAAEDLGAIFDIEIDDAPIASAAAITTPKKPASKKAAKKAPAAEKPASKKVAKKAPAAEKPASKKAPVAEKPVSKKASTEKPASKKAAKKAPASKRTPAAGKAKAAQARKKG